MGPCHEAPPFLRAVLWFPPYPVLRKRPPLQKLPAQFPPWYPGLVAVLSDPITLDKIGHLASIEVLEIFTIAMIKFSSFGLPLHHSLSPLPSSIQSHRRHQAIANFPLLSTLRIQDSILFHASASPECDFWGFRRLFLFIRWVRGHGPMKHRSRNLIRITASAEHRVRRLSTQLNSQQNQNLQKR
ncbi:uncharacterized protein EI90DRAFT_919139 [Cantharellus anzutake]|uniref:uncharacterized protein n=1 Tax=Cantharellus anzutake TaxID=1750568 RepID=UPI001905B377|nr:uncharacterized protein EI90DRAFT_919139 [Cantharellus anzutake]KAF8332053.1 hypothetical protein EI90DRAFT_919139 [Cantharellus anzutake]